MTEKQLIVVIEGTAAVGPFWQTILSDYLEKIIRCFCGNESTMQKPSTSSVELSLVMFAAHGSCCSCLVQRNGWTRDVDVFLQWLSAIPFAGGGFSDAAIAEGLSEALMMFCVAPNGCQTQQNGDGQKHCILVTASNPYSLPTPVYRPQMQNMEQSENHEEQAESHLADAETVAKSFSECSVSLSVICPKQLPKVRAVYNAGKRNPRVPDPPLDYARNHQYLILISESFQEACAALSRPVIATLPSNQSPIKLDVLSVPPLSGPPSTSVNGSVMSRQPTSVGNIPTATVKIEPSTTMACVVSASSFSHLPSISRPSSQGVLGSASSSTSMEMIPSGDNVPDLKPNLSCMPQSLRPVGHAAANVSILNNLCQAQHAMRNASMTGGTSIGLQSLGATPMAVHMSNMVSCGMTSSVPPAQPIFSSGQSGITSVIGSGSLSGTSQIAQSSANSSLTSANSILMGNSSLNIPQSLGNPQGGVSMSQSVLGMNQGNLSGMQMVQSGLGMNQNIMNALASSAVSSGTVTMIPTPGLSHQVQPGIQALGTNNNSAAHMPLSQQTSCALQPVQSKYVKVWEGNLSGQRQQQPVFITRLEGYRSASASETLAANWPQTMQIVRLISQDHMNNKQYDGKADFLVFRAINQHGFLGQLQEKKLCAVIQLPSQTLLLSVSDKACRLIGMLFPGDSVVFKPQISGQHQQQLQQLQQHQLNQQFQTQQLPQLQQQQQMVGAYVQGQGRTQMVPQAQVAPQGPPGMSGGAFLS